MADALASATSSLLFGTRNIEKANEGHVGKIAVATGQAKKVADYVATLDNKAGDTTRSIFQSVEKAAKSEKLLEYAGRAVNFAAKNINPLICISAGIDVLSSDDKEAAIVTNSTALASMFAVEHLMKKYLDEIPKFDCLKGISEKVMKFAKENKCEGKLPAIIHGVAFVIGSCTAYSAGEKFGQLLLGNREKQEPEA